MSFRKIKFIKHPREHLSRIRNAVEMWSENIDLKRHSKNLLNQAILGPALKIGRSFDLYRNGQETEALLPRFSEAVRRFLSRAPLEESTVIIDGPGIGCATPMILLALIGMERLRKLKAVHFFSSASYGGLLLHAKETGDLTLTENEVIGFHRRNQALHEVQGGKTIVSLLKSRIFGKQFLFSNCQAEKALSLAVSEKYLGLTLRELPASFHFWVFDQTSRSFRALHAQHPTYSHWTTSEIVRASTAVPVLYEPLVKDGHLFSDALLAPGVRNLFKALRKQSRNVLFWHVNVGAERNQTIFVRGHQGKSGLIRVISDFLLFVSGLDNRDLDQALKAGLFKLKPLTGACLATSATSSSSPRAQSLSEGVSR